MNFIDIPSFINTHITKRNVSMFQRDLDDFNTEFTTEIASKSVLVIGGAGTIGSSFIKALLKFKPAKLIVVDTNENGLTELTRDLRSEHVQSRPFWMPMNQLQMFKDSIYITTQNQSAKIYENCISIPSSASITSRELLIVVSTIKTFYQTVPSPRVYRVIKTLTKEV
jgi:shikimate 5-dehydrogenase